MPEIEGPDFLKWINTAWVERLKGASHARKDFMAAAKQLWMFTFQDTSAMWNDPDRTKWMGKSVKPPGFMVSVNKGFEFLAVIGPYLFWQNPFRRVAPIEPLEISPEMFGDPNDPYVQQQFQAIQMMSASEQSSDNLRCQLMERYLNYSQREQPHGLYYHSQLAIADAMITGRGILWPQTYSPPGSNRVLTGLFWDSIENFFVDPDCADPTLKDANWIARRHVEPHWVVEERFGLPRNSLLKAARVDSIENDSLRRAAKSKDHSTHDQVVWYEIWSRCGVGTKLKGGQNLINDPKAAALGEAVGDFAYIAICSACDKPLNAYHMPSQEEMDAGEIPLEQITEPFQWPFPCWDDNRWPVAVLDFYPEPGKAWPVAPLAAALGEIIALNCLISAFTEMAYENRKQIIAYRQSLETKLQEALDSDRSITTMALNDAANARIEDVVSFLKRPDVNYDVLKAIEYLEEMIARRTGMVPFVYAASGTQSRSAQDVASKAEQSQVRPEKMAKDVAAWQSEAATLEAQLAQRSVTAQDIAPLMGQAMAMAWDMAITQGDPELMARQFRCTIAASDVRRPDKSRETANMQDMSQYLLPILQQYAANSTDPTPLNNFLKTYGDSVQQDTSGWMMGPWQPQVQEDPAVAQMQAQAAMIKAQADAMNAQQQVGVSAAQAEELTTESELNEAKVKEIDDKIKKGYYKPKPAAPKSSGAKK